MSTGLVPGLRVCSIPSHPIPSLPSRSVHVPPLAYGSSIHERRICSWAYVARRHGEGALRAPVPCPPETKSRLHTLATDIAYEYTGYM